MPLVSDNHLYLKSYLKGATVYNQKESCKTRDIVLYGGLVSNLFCNARISLCCLSAKSNLPIILVCSGHLCFES